MVVSATATAPTPIQAAAVAGQPAAAVPITYSSVIQPPTTTTIIHPSGVQVRGIATTQHQSQVTAATTASILHHQSAAAQQQQALRRQQQQQLQQVCSLTK